MMSFKEQMSNTMKPFFQHLCKRYRNNMADLERDWMAYMDGKIDFMDEPVVVAKSVDPVVMAKQIAALQHDDESANEVKTRLADDLESTASSQHSKVEEEPVKPKPTKPVKKETLKETFKETTPEGSTSDDEEEHTLSSDLVEATLDDDDTPTQKPTKQQKDESEEEEETSGDDSSSSEPVKPAPKTKAKPSAKKTDTKPAAKKVVSKKKEESESSGSGEPSSGDSETSSDSETSESSSSSEPVKPKKGKAPAKKEVTLEVANTPKLAVGDRPTIPKGMKFLKGTSYVVVSNQVVAVCTKKGIVPLGPIHTKALDSKSTPYVSWDAAKIKSTKKW